MLFSKLSRRGGLAATVTAPLFIVADLLGLFTVSVQGPAYGMIIRNISAVGAEVLLLLGLIALFGYHLEAMSKPGLLGFSVILVGLLLATGNFLWAYWLGEQGWGLFFIWTSLLASLGWILFGAVGLEAQIYPRGPVVLIVGVVLYGVANALIGSGTQSGALADSQDYVVGVVIYNVILTVATSLFGLKLLRRGKAEISVYRSSTRLQFTKRPKPKEASKVRKRGLRCLLLILVVLAAQTSLGIGVFVENIVTRSIVRSGAIPTLDHRT